MLSAHISGEDIMSAELRLAKLVNVQGLQCQAPENF